MMLRALAGLFAGLVAIASAHADTIGTPPIPNGDFATINQTWLNGLAGGQNATYLNNITANASGIAALAFQITGKHALYEVDTAATSGASLRLPPCLAAFRFQIFDNTSNPINIYGYNATDTINGILGTTPFTISAGNVGHFTCAKTGVWSAVLWTAQGGGAGTPFLSFSGPSSGFVGDPSTNFTVAVVPSGVDFNGSATITLSDGTSGGTFRPSVGSSGVSTVTVTPTFGTTNFTFTYAAATVGFFTLSVTNGQSWNNPPPLAFAATTAPPVTQSALVIGIP